MAPLPIPAANSQAVNTGGGVPSFIAPWWNFFNSLLTYVTTGPIGPVPLAGVTDGSNAAAGNVGEYLSAFRLVGSAINLPNGTPVQITTLTLTAGDWDVEGEVFFQPTGANLAAVAAAMSIASVISPVVPADAADRGVIEGFVTNDIMTINGMWARVNVTVTTPYFLVGVVDFGAATTCVGYGGLRARRRR